MITTLFQRSLPLTDICLLDVVGVQQSLFSR